MLEEVISELSEILECEKDTLSAETRFKESRQWDSLAHISTISMIDDMFDVIVSNDTMKELTTISDLVAFIQKKTQA